MKKSFINQLKDGIQITEENSRKRKLELIPYTKDEEMEEIEEIFGEPEKYKNQEFISRKL